MDEKLKLYLGDCLSVLKTIEDNSIHAVVTDPPYGLKFMNKAWDYDVPKVEIWKEVLRVLKPGGHLLSFGGTRTYHRMVVNIEDAGFEIRDQIQWLYGSGFPKSLNLKEEWEGWGTALKPANEPIVMARKPIEKGLTVAENVIKWGTGAININASRISTNGKAVWKVPESDKKSTSLMCFDGGSEKSNTMFKNKGGQMGDTQGRWPANLLLDEQAAEMLGDPSRFFYVAKTSKSERNKGLEGIVPKHNDFQRKTSGLSTTTIDGIRQKGNCGQPNQNHHPTVKPIKLMKYLITLITPSNGIVLDPFMGSGSTGVAAKELGFDFIGIELNEEYLEIAKRRISG